MVKRDLFDHGLPIYVCGPGVSTMIGKSVLGSWLLCGLIEAQAGGKGWEAIKPEPNLPPLTEIIAAGDTLYLGTFGKGVYRSTDEGATWKRLDSAYGRAQNVRRLVSHGGYLFLGSAAGGVYRSGDQGQSWQAANQGLYDSTAARKGLGDVLALHSFGFDLFACGSGTSIYRSSDKGATWNAFDSGLTGIREGSQSANCIAHIGAKLFLGTQRGLYRSLDNGATWGLVKGGMEDTAHIRSLSVYGNVILAGMGWDGYTGGGIYRSADSGGTWTRVPNATIDKSVIPVNAFVVSGSVIFAALDDLRGIFHSGDAGISFADADSSDLMGGAVAMALQGPYLFSTGLGVVWRRPVAEMATALISSNRRRGFKPRPIREGSRIFLGSALERRDSRGRAISSPIR